MTILDFVAANPPVLREVPVVSARNVAVFWEAVAQAAVRYLLEQLEQHQLMVARLAAHAEWRDSIIHKQRATLRSVLQSCGLSERLIDAIEREVER